MIKRILNYFFGKKETNETPVNSIHDEINETLKKRKEILNYRVNLFQKTHKKSQ